MYHFRHCIATRFLHGNINDSWFLFFKFFAHVIALQATLKYMMVASTYNNHLLTCVIVPMESVN